MPDNRLKFGCHDFLNSKPITYSLMREEFESCVDLTLAPPAILAESLSKGELDMAFIPAIEYARTQGVKIVRGFSIAAMGEVKTVLMFSDESVWNIKKVAADHRSRTSIALLKILFKEYYKTDVSVIPRKSHDPQKLLTMADAGMVIGDEAFKVNRDEHKVTDLSQAWHAFTGKSFTFAVICVRDGVDPMLVREAIAVLAESKKAGLENIAEIAARESQKLGIDEETCREYLLKNIRYNLDRDDQEGLTDFLSLAAEHGIIEENKELEFFST